jgi:PAS domain S-box-containing protein
MADGFAPDLTEQLRFALAKIAQLEAARSEPQKAALRSHEIADHQPVEEALRKSEERYLLAEWATNDGLWDWTPGENDYCYFSPRFKALLSLQEDELENRAAAIFERIHPEDLPRLHESVRRNWEERQPYDLEVRIRLKDGSYRWFRTRGQAIRDQLGAVKRMVGSISDIHDRKRAESITRDQDQQWRQMLDTVEQLAWITLADGRNLWFNTRWYEYTGIQAGQMEWRSAHDPDALPRIMDRWSEATRTGESFEMEFPLKGADGVFRSFLTRAVPVRDSEGKIVKWFGTSTNIDAMRKQQDALKESEQKFRELAEALPEMLWVTDRNGKLIYNNTQLNDYAGLPQEHDVEERLSRIHPDDAARHYKTRRAALETGQEYEHESRVRRHDGVYRWFLHRAKPVRDTLGRPFKWIGTSTDIHEQKLTEEALRRSKEDLEQFAYAASHDLREPLRMMSIYSELLLEFCAGKAVEAEQFAHHIVSGAKQMDDLLKGMLSYSQAVGETPVYEHSDSGAALRSALRNLQAGIKESGATISHDALPWVVFPEAQLVQLFQNLIANSIKYRSDRPPHIHIAARPEAGQQRFSIADNGIGIRQEYLEQIFGVFRRLHKTEYPGVGIGLAICKRIVEKQGGKIWAESEFGRGTTFHFTLPSVR